MLSIFFALILLCHTFHQGSFSFCMIQHPLNFLNPGLLWLILCYFCLQMSSFHFHPSGIFSLGIEFQAGSYFLFVHERLFSSGFHYCSCDLWWWPLFISLVSFILMCLIILFILMNLFILGIYWVSWNGRFFFPHQFWKLSHYSCRFCLYSILFPSACFL